MNQNIVKGTLSGGIKDKNLAMGLSVFQSRYKNDQQFYNGLFDLQNQQRRRLNKQYESIHVNWVPGVLTLFVIIYIIRKI